jgi:hypothetical protein
MVKFVGQRDVGTTTGRARKRPANDRSGKENVGQRTSGNETVGRDRRIRTGFPTPARFDPSGRELGPVGARDSSAERCRQPVATTKIRFTRRSLSSTPSVAHSAGVDGVHPPLTLATTRRRQIAQALRSRDDAGRGWGRVEGCRARSRRTAPLSTSAQHNWPPAP